MTTHERTERDAAHWLAAKDRLGASWTADDEARLQSWLAQDLAHRVAWLRLGDAWRRADRLGEAFAGAMVVRSAPRRVWHPRWPAAALVAVITLFIGGWWLVAMVQEPARFATPVGGRQYVPLEDGSRVTLNTRTRARAEVSEHERRFWLDEGEAYFDIQHDAQRPFVVIAGQDRITVLGTRFSVRRLHGATQVLVEQGRVRVERLAVAGAPPLDLKAGAAADLQAERVALRQASSAQVEQALQWRQGRLTFRDTSLAEAAAEFNRYHRRQLVVDPAVAGMRIGGSFEAENLDGFVRLVHEGFGLSVRTEGDRIALGPP